jgi:WD40 repeat protein
VSITQALVEPRDSPYFGLDYYREKFGAWFFGREAEGGKVITNLRAARLTLLHAESGVGKSSLLRAGVAWRMRRLANDTLERRGSARSVPVVFSSWEDDPVPQLVAAIGSAIRPYLAGSPEPQLPADSLDAAIGVASSAAHTSLLLMLDQFEEYFLYCAHEPTPERFADQLAACVNRADLRANFLIAIREDAYAGLGDLFKGRIANVYGNYLHIEYLDRPSAEMAIREPLQVYNNQPHVSEPVKIEDELVEAVLDEVRAYDSDRDAELGRAAAANGSAARVSTPLLQLVMETIWQRERAEGSHELRLSTLQNLRGVQMIADTHLEKALSDMGSGERRTAVDLFDHIVTPSGGKIAESVPDLANRTGHSEGEVGSVLDKLDDSRIVRPVPAPPGQDPVRFRRYEIFHDVLAPAINHTIAAYEERRRARRLRRFAYLLVGLLIVTLAVASVVVYLFQTHNEKLTADSRALAADADVNTARDPELSVLLALRALRVHDTSQAKRALRAALPELQVVRMFRVGTTVHSAAFDPADANKVAGADRSGMARIWDVQARHRPVPMSLGGFKLTENAMAVAFSRAGTQVAVGYAKGQVGVFDARGGKKLQSYTFPGSPIVYGVNFVGGTDTLAIATQKGAYRWAPGNGSTPSQMLRNRQNMLSGGANAIAVDPHDLQKYAIATGNGTVIVDLRHSDHSIMRSQSLTQGQPAGTADADARFSPDGRQVVTADGDGKVRVYSAATGKTVMTLDAGDADATSVAFSPDGSLIAAGYSSGMTRVWEVSTRVQLMQLAGNAGRVHAVRFSPDGSKVVTASDDGTVRVWYARPRELQAKFAGSYANGVPNRLLGAQYISRDRIVALDDAGDDAGNLNVFTPGGTRLARINSAGTRVHKFAVDNAGTQIVTADSDGTVRVWHAGDADYTRMTPSSPAVQVTGVRGVAMSADGSHFTLLTSGNYHQVQVRSAQTGQLMKTLHAANPLTPAVAFSPDGRQIVAGDYVGQVEKWDAATGHLRLLGTGGPWISDVEFNKSGSEFVAVSGGGTVTVWAAPADWRLSSFQACPSPNAASPSPDGSKIVVACGDGSALVFDAATGQQLTTLPATSTGAASSVGFSPDGKSIITAVNAEGTGAVQVWNAELANPSISVIERIANGRTTRQLGPAERSTYLAGISG